MVAKTMAKAAKRGVKAVKRRQRNLTTRDMRWLEKSKRQAADRIAKKTKTKPRVTNVQKLQKDVKKGTSPKPPPLPPQLKAKAKAMAERLPREPNKKDAKALLTYGEKRFGNAMKGVTVAGILASLAIFYKGLGKKKKDKKGGKDATTDAGKSKRPMPRKKSAVKKSTKKATAKKATTKKSPAKKAPAKKKSAKSSTARTSGKTGAGKKNFRGTVKGLMKNARSAMAKKNKMKGRSGRTFSRPSYRDRLEKRTNQMGRNLVEAMRLYNEKANHRDIMKRLNRIMESRK